MKHIMWTLIAGALILYYPALQAQDYTLPENPATPVITLDYQIDRLKRIDQAPTLTILANGSIIMPKIYAHSLAYSGQISMLELQELMDFIIRENQFFAYDESLVETKLNKQRRQPLPVHVSITAIEVNVKGQSKQVSITQLGSTPMVEETERMLAIRQRLDQLMSIVRLQSAGQLYSLLNVANTELDLKLHNDPQFSDGNLQNSNIAPFSTDNLVGGGGARADGSIYARFEREDGVSVTIDILADGQRLVTVAKDKEVKGDE